jgi:hypothetical protein
MIAWEIGAGELLDRLAILELKLGHSVRDEQRSQLAAAVERARAARRAAQLDAPGLRELERELAEVNHALWQAEDEIRARERAGDWAGGFVAVARAICQLNDRRAALKSAIDRLCGFIPTDEKTYQERDGAGKESNPNRI